VDPDRANAKIEGTVNIGSSGPLSGGPAAAAFAPVIKGFQAYIDYANEKKLLPDHDIKVTFGDDQYDPALTPGVINSALDGGAQVISEIIGTPNNLAVRDTLNEECVPQLMAASGDPAFGDVANYPWTIGANLPYDVEWKAYAEDVATAFPDGAKAAVFYVNNDAGAVSKKGFEDAAKDLNIEIVDDQTIEATETAPPTAQLSSIAGKKPDVIVAFPLGAQCPTFLSELANQKAANSGWDPRVYLTNTCASPLILGIAGQTANGIYTSASFGAVDITNPANQTIPGVAEYLSYMQAHGLTDTIPTSAAGWNYAEVTVEMLKQAAESPEGLTQASIINAARNFDYHGSIVREGINFKTDGETDGFLVEDVQIAQYDATTKFFNDVGKLITKFESS
jgi:ABC-type branched-subunit amino acid transport system substrate-binding protein